jgi:hypothetical protein
MNLKTKPSFIIFTFQSTDMQPVIFSVLANCKKIPFHEPFDTNDFDQIYNKLYEENKLGVTIDFQDC